MADLNYWWCTPAAPAAIAWLACPATLPAGLFDRPLPAPGRAGLRRLRDPHGQSVDEVVVWHTETQRLEIGTHGGPGVRAAVDRALAGHGLVAANPPADRWARLARAVSPAACRWLLDHGDDEPPFAAAWLERAPVILLTGPANAGKSTLLNAWCGEQRAVVSDLAGTTRDLVAAETVQDGWRLRLVDSAGLRAAADHLERQGQELAVAARERADCILHLQAPGHPAPAPAGAVLVHGKADLRPTPWPALAWAGPSFVGAARAEELLAAIGAAVLARLGLPPLPTAAKE